MKIRNDIKSFEEKVDVDGATKSIMRKLAHVLVEHRSDFIDLLNYSGISANENLPDAILIEKYIENAHNNKRLLIGTAFLINKHESSLNFDGEPQISNQQIQNYYKSMYVFFDTGFYPDVDDNADFSNAGGPGGQAISDAINQVAQLGSHIADNQRAKKYGAQDLAMKKIEAKNELIKSALETRKIQAEASREKMHHQATTTKIIIIGAVGLTLVGLISLIVLHNKK